MKFYYNPLLHAYRIIVEDGSHVLWIDGCLYVDEICIRDTRISYYGTAQNSNTNNLRVLDVGVKKGSVDIQVSNRPPYDLDWGDRWQELTYLEFMEKTT